MTMMRGRTDENVRSSLRCLVTLLNYFEIEIEADAMKEHRAVGTWQLMKNGFKRNLIFWFLGLPHLVDELTTKPVRSRAPVSFDGDIDRVLKNRRL